MRRRYSARQLIGLLSGIPIFLTILFIPISAELSAEAQKVLAIAFLMALWWITEALPIPSTALIPLILFPLLKVLPAAKTAVSYADKNIFLFMGGFFIAMTMQKWNLHKRIALYIIFLIGGAKRQIILGFMIASALLSMWISNTATTMMMLPIALAVSLHFEDKTQKNDNFSIALMLGIAYAASVGGVGTLIGTPPNLVFASQLKLLFPEKPDVEFLQWLKIGLPFVLIFLPIIWVILTFLVYPVKNTGITSEKDSIRLQLKDLGAISKGERYTLVIFIITALLWIFRADISMGKVTIPGWESLLGVKGYVHDSTVAIFSAILLFSIPVNLKEGVFLLDWDWAKRIPWGILILFGGGIALAEGFRITGLARWIGSGLEFFGSLPQPLVILIISLMMTFLTELTSNTATSVIFMPIMAAAAIGLSAPPELFMIPAVISASCAFMLPVATPPNAIVFGSGFLRVPQMAKAGIILNLVGAVLITLLVYFVVKPVFSLN